MTVPTPAHVRSDVRPDTPKRLRRSRAAGSRQPAGAVYVGRPSRWGNPWKAGDDHPWFPAGSRLMTAQDAVDFYERQMLALGDVDRKVLLVQLRGKDLVCWCPLDAPCHADVLLKLANEVQA